MNSHLNVSKPIAADDIFVLTSAGERQLKDSETSASRLELKLLVLVNGSSSVAQILTRVAGTPQDAVLAALQRLFDKKLIARAPVFSGGEIEAGDFLSTSTFYAAKGATGEDEIEAADGAGYLQAHGYYVRIARRSPVERKPVAGGRFSVVIVEDEPHLSKLLKAFFSMEGFDTRTAANRAEVVEALRKPPVPDLILLDVELPDADGFEILGKVRQHPAFKSTAVVMLTAKSTREAVLQGLAGGADGYITKPFDMDLLVKAVHSVFGTSPR